MRQLYANHDTAPAWYLTSTRTLAHSTSSTLNVCLLKLTFSKACNCKGKSTPLQVWGFQKVEDPTFQDNRQSKVESFISPMHRPSLPLRNYSWYSFLLETESTPGLKCDRKGYVSEKIPMTPYRIEPATFRLVVQCLNQRKKRKYLALNVSTLHINKKNVTLWHDFCVPIQQDCINCSQLGTKKT
jgi:hypothetical protein